MPAINFPEQPGLQTPENTFSPVSVPESSKNGITYTYDNGVWSVAPIEIGGGTGDGNASIITSDYPPNNPPPKDGDLWWNTSNNTLYIYYVDEDTSQWVVSTPNDNNGGAQIDVGEEPPSSPTDGALWWNTDDNTLYIYYDEGDGGTSQWVIASPGGSGGSGGVGGSLEIPASDEPPTLPSEGDLWWSTTDNTLYIYYRDEDTEQWVVTVPSAGIGTLQQVTDAGNNTTNDITLGTDKITLDATDGRASFAGSIAAATGSINGVSLDSYGLFIDNRTAGVQEAGITWYQSRTADNFPNASRLYCHGDEGLKWYVSDAGFFDGNEVPIVTLDRDGNASFTGDVSCDNFYGVNIQTYTSVDTTYQYRAVYNGNCNFTVTNRGAYFGGTQAFNGNGSNAQINADGSAEFAGAVTSGNLSSDYNFNGAGYLGINKISPAAGEKAIIVYNNGVPQWTVDFQGNAAFRNAIFNLEPDNDANYVTTTDVDEEGNTVETRVYNGPTLDVKDRLTKTQDALTALRAAAQDNATDLAGLKAAIVSALSDI